MPTLEEISTLQCGSTPIMAARDATAPQDKYNMPLCGQRRREWEEDIILI